MTTASTSGRASSVRQRLVGLDPELLGQRRRPLAAPDRDEPAVRHVPGQARGVGPAHVAGADDRHPDRAHEADSPAGPTLGPAGATLGPADRSTPRDERVDLATHPLRLARQLLARRQPVERHGEHGVERLGVARRPADVERVAQPQVDLPFDEVLGPLVLEPAGHDRGQLDLALDDLDRQVDPDVGMEVERRRRDRVAQDAALVGERVGEVGRVEQDAPDRRVIRGPVAGRRRAEDVRRPALLQDPGQGVLHPRGVVGDPVVGRLEELDRGAERGGHVARGGLLDRRHGHDVDVVVGVGDERAADAVDEVIGMGRDDQDLHERPSRDGSAGTGGRPVSRWRPPGRLA